MQMIPGVEAILPVSLFDNHVCIEKVYRSGSYYTRSSFIALSKQEPAPLKKTISDHGDRSKGRFSGATLHVRYPTFGTNGLSEM